MCVIVGWFDSSNKINVINEACKSFLIEDLKIAFLRYQIEQHLSNNVYQGELTPLYRNKGELNQVLRPKFKQWFTSDERRIDVVVVTPGGSKTYSTTQALVECCRQATKLCRHSSSNTSQRVLEEQQLI